MMFCFIPTTQTTAQTSCVCGENQGLSINSRPTIVIIKTTFTRVSCTCFFLYSFLKIINIILILPLPILTIANLHEPNILLPSLHMLKVNLVFSKTSCVKWEVFY